MDEDQSNLIFLEQEAHNPEITGSNPSRLLPSHSVCLPWFSIIIHLFLNREEN